MLQPFELADNDETVNKIELSFREAVDLVPCKGLLHQAGARGAEQESCCWHDSARKRKRKRKVAVWFCGVLQNTALQPRHRSRASALRSGTVSVAWWASCSSPGGFITSRRHLHVAPMTLRHTVLLEGSASRSKKSFSLLVYRKKKPT